MGFNVNNFITFIAIILIVILTFLEHIWIHFLLAIKPKKAENVRDSCREDYAVNDGVAETQRRQSDEDKRARDASEACSTTVVAHAVAWESLHEAQVDRFTKRNLNTNDYRGDERQPEHGGDFVEEAANCDENECGHKQDRGDHNSGAMLHFEQVGRVDNASGRAENDHGELEQWHKFLVIEICSKVVGTCHDHHISIVVDEAEDEKEGHILFIVLTEMLILQGNNKYELEAVRL